MARERPPTTDEICRAIDNGETDDKVNFFPDPAAAPLGADDEAAGRPPDTARREEALLTERQSPGRAPGAAEGGRGRAALWAVMVAILIALALIAYAFWSH